MRYPVTVEIMGSNPIRIAYALVVYWLRRWSYTSVKVVQFHPRVRSLLSNNVKLDECAVRHNKGSYKRVSQLPYLTVLRCTGFDIQILHRTVTEIDHLNVRVRINRLSNRLLLGCNVPRLAKDICNVFGWVRFPHGPQTHKPKYLYSGE